jgi:hypothetical protein
MKRLPRRAERQKSAGRQKSAWHRWPIPAPAVASGVAILAGICVIIALAGGDAAAGSSGGAAGIDQRPGQPTAAGGTGTGISPSDPAPASPTPASPTPASPTPASPTPASSGGAAGVVSQLHGIVLPDVLIVVPAGLTADQAARLHAIGGVADMITFDGAQITADGQPASVIGVSPGQFRSWVPLRTASDQVLWTDLAAGRFLASNAAAAILRLQPGGSYQLTGTVSRALTFGSSARLGISGIDLLVNQAVSRQLGLVPRVAALISAPGLSMTRLLNRVHLILGPGAKVVSLRSHQLPVTTTQPSQVTNYLQLFQASAARYCPGLSWTVLAAIGQIESGDGRNVGPSTAGALGPMQFEPSTWAAWGIDGFGPAGPPDVMNALDAVPAAARLLCADGAVGKPAALRGAIFDYNHATWYVNEVLALAAQYATSYR